MDEYIGFNLIKQSDSFEIRNKRYKFVQAYIYSLSLLIVLRSSEREWVSAHVNMRERASAAGDLILMYAQINCQLQYTNVRL